MAQQIINIGSADYAGDGESLRSAFNKTNTNFTDLYTQFSQSLSFDGDYNSLTNKPVLFNGDYNNLSNLPSLFSGNYSDLANKPSIPSTIDSLTNVNITSVQDGQVLKFDNTSGSWVNDTSNNYDQDLNTTDSVEFLNITQQQTVGVNNYTTTISQNGFNTKFAKVDIVDDGDGGTFTLTRNVLLDGNALRFDNSLSTSAYIKNNSTSGHLYIEAGGGAPIDGQRNGGDLYLWAGARAGGATAGGNINMNSNGGDILIGPLENTDQIRIGGAPGYAGQSTTTFYGDVNFASGKNVNFTGTTVTGLSTGADVYLVDGGSATAIYTNGDLVLDGGSA